MTYSAVPPATARLLGQTSNVAFQYSCGWGARPSTGRLVAVIPSLTGVQDAVTDLTLSQGDFSMTLTDVRIATISENRPSGRGIVEVSFEDRRWKWAFGYVDGDYNVRRADGTLTREKTPRQLATLLAAAINEPNMDVAALPNDSRPRKVWRAANPRDELERLCSELGCVVAFDAYNDAAFVVKVGDGNDIPGEWEVTQQRSAMVAAPPWPDEVRAIGGNVLFQSAFKLGEPQGYETDGTLKSIDALSYKPAGGWGEPYEFVDLETTYTVAGETRYHRDLAAQSVWRLYRIVELESGDWSPAALNNTPQEPTSKDDVGPFQTTLLERDVVTNERKPAVIKGVFYDGREAFKNTTAGQLYKGTFSIDNEKKLVVFSEPVFKFAGANGENPPLAAADLVLYCAYETSKDGVPTRYEKWQSVPGGDYNVGARVEHFPLIVREVIEQRPHGGQGSDNQSACDAEFDHYLTAMKAEYAQRTGAELTYTGLRPFHPDGVLRSVTWAGGVSQAATTACSYNVEPNPYVRDYRDTPAARARMAVEAAMRNDARTSA